MAQAVTPIPTGTVTFLFTDIESSTERWDRAPDAMREAVRKHDAIIRAAIARRQGHVFKTMGDAFCAAFATPDAALGAAVDAQHALEATDFSTVEGLRVRMAVNAGIADEREGDYFGPALNRVARLLAIGHGGQILVSHDAASLVRSALPDGVKLSELGSHRLKGFAEAQSVYQVETAKLRADFPPLRSLGALTNNLPAEVSSFVGRSAERHEIARALDQRRLVTVVGPGGIGKTRISLQVAARESAHFADGVWFIELAQTSDGTAIPSLIAGALGESLPPGDDLTALCTLLRNKTLLLVLDNCEHVLEQTSSVASALLRAAPRLRILASSRQPLGISGEAVVRVQALPRADAALLFELRAQEADVHLTFSDEDAPAVVRIVERLDCIPLAIELAAARVRSLGVRKLEQRLAERFRVLVGGGRDAAQRQQTLRATIDWSYDLLDGPQRRMFRSAGTFAGSFTAQACAFVDQDGAFDEDAAFDALCSLEDQSLVVLDREGDATRFRLLESMRAYALERADEQGERATLAQRHLTFFRALAERAESDFLASGSDAAYVSAVAPEVNEVRSALSWALNGGDVEAGAALLTAIGRPWRRVGFSSEGISRVQAFIEAVPPSQTRLLARLWTELGWLAGSALHNAQAYEAATRGVVCARSSQDSATLAWSLAYFALVAARQRRFDEADAALGEARRLSESDGAAGQRLTELEITAFVAQLRGDLDVAAETYRKQLALLHSIGDEYAAANATISVAETEHARGNTSGAIELVRSLLPSASGLMGRESHAAALANLAGYLLALNQSLEARQAVRDAIDLLAERDPSSVWVIIALEHFALACALDGDVKRAARLEAYCDVAFAAVGFQRESTEQRTHLRLGALLRERLDAAALQQARAEGAALSPERAIEETLRSG
ncbi:MAG: adenylate/guanylate cyclase domain-containing protein [Candidatus Eremiobacteraeota bacterium]|nr:adenylate/guanylate cyclase domain-containing protein [Candidatus Eremiobacteraeota bacterium]